MRDKSREREYEQGGGVSLWTQVVSNVQHLPQKGLEVWPNAVSSVPEKLIGRKRKMGSVGLPPFLGCAKDPPPGASPDGTKSSTNCQST